MSGWRTRLLSAFPVIALGGVVIALSPLDAVSPARRMGAIAAGTGLLLIGVLGCLLARVSWRELESRGLLREARLADVAPARIAALAWRRGAAALLAVLTPWLILVPLLLGSARWSRLEVVAWTVLLPIHAALALSSGLLGSWLEGRRGLAPGLGVAVLALWSTPPLLLTASVIPMLRPSDLLSWITRCLALTTPLGVIAPAQGEPGAALWLTGLAAWLSVALCALLTLALFSPVVVRRIR